AAVVGTPAAPASAAGAPPADAPAGAAAGWAPAAPATAARAAATGGPTPAAGGSKLLRWAIWGAIVLAIAIFSRAKLRAGGSGPAAR
ncbi:MAG: hypothetical protein ACKOHK_03810, partial [Planctomycetia bacterium]